MKNQMVLHVSGKGTYSTPVSIKNIEIFGKTRRCNTSKTVLWTMEDVFKTLDWTARGINVNGERISHFRFTDDIVIFTEALEELSGVLNVLRGSSRQIGLGINFVMFNERGIRRESPPWPFSIPLSLSSVSSIDLL